MRKRADRIGGILRGGAFGLLALGAMADASAQAAGEWRGPEHMYRSICRYCHDTGVSPVLQGRQLPVEYIVDRVRKGFGAMPAFKPSELSDADLDALAQWLAGNPTPAPPKPGR